MRLLILNPDLPVFPARAGHEYLHTTRLARAGHRVGLVSLVHVEEQRQKMASLSGAGVSLFLWQDPRLDRTRPSGRPARRRRWRMALAPLVHRLSAGLIAPADTLVQDFQLSNIARPILNAFLSARWDAVIVVQSSCARWFDTLPRVPVTALVLHDVRALVYERASRAAMSPIERARLAVEAARYRRHERRYCRAVDLVITVSEADEAWVRQHYDPPRVFTVSIPVDCDYFRPQPEVEVVPARIVFTGMMDHAPNVDAVAYFASRVFPRVRAAVPGAEFWIVGRDPAPEVSALAAQPGVVVTGLVPDIRPHLAAAGVIVVPLRFGSGMRNKILEAWAMQKCVVSTSMGAEGLSYADGENILIADTDETLADRVTRAITDQALRDRVRGGGRDLVRVRHDPERLADQYARSLAAVLREKRAPARPMRVLVDLRWMQPGVAGGIENLSRALVDSLLSLDRQTHYRILVPSAARFEFDLRHRPNFEVVAADGPASLWRWARWMASESLAARLGAASRRPVPAEHLRTLRRFDVDLVLSTSGYIAADLFPLPNVLIAYDLQHEYHPEFFTREALAERRRVFGESIQRARHIIATSEHTRQNIIERLGIAPERITTAYGAADPMFARAGRAGHNGAATLEKYGLRPGSYLFFPANTWPHKNHRAAFEALHLLAERHRLVMDLVCTGAAKEAHGELLELASRLGIRERVRFMGYCPAEDMPGLYAGAAALVFPSFFEGFGIPVVEAMWCGCPVVASNVTSIPEVAGDAAMLVDPRSPEQLASSLARLLTEPALRDAMVERGRRQAARFSWSRFTSEVVRALRQTFEDGPIDRERP